MARYVILFTLSNFKWRPILEDRQILKNLLFVYLFVFPMIWVVFIEFPLGYDFWEDLMYDGLKFYTLFIVLSGFFGFLSWAVVPFHRVRKKLIYFAIFILYSICIGLWFAAYSLSHFGF